MAYTGTLKHGEPLMADYTPGSSVSAGDVAVQGDLVGLALHDIGATAKGALAVNNFVATLPKNSGTSTAITAGAKVYWDATYLIATTTAGSNKQIGKCEVAAGDDDTTVDVLWTQ